MQRVQRGGGDGCRASACARRSAVVGSIFTESSQYAQPVAFSRAAENSCATPVCAAHAVTLKTKPVVTSHDSSCTRRRQRPGFRLGHACGAAARRTEYDGARVGTPVGEADGTNVGVFVEETAGQ